MNSLKFKHWRLVSSIQPLLLLSAYTTIKYLSINFYYHQKSKVFNSWYKYSQKSQSTRPITAFSRRHQLIGYGQTLQMIHFTFAWKTLLTLLFILKNLLTMILGRRLIKYSRFWIFSRLLLKLGRLNWRKKVWSKIRNQKNLLNILLVKLLSEMRSYFKI